MTTGTYFSPIVKQNDNQVFLKVFGRVSTPAEGAVIADTGSVPAGDYFVEVMLFGSDTAAAGRGMIVAHRDSTNAVDVQLLGGVVTPFAIQIHIRRYTLASNERIRVVAGAAAAAGSTYIAAIVLRVAP